MVTKICATFNFESGVKQVIHISNEAHKYMLSSGGVKANLNKIKSDLGASDFSFEIFPD